MSLTIEFARQKYYFCFVNEQEKYIKRCIVLAKNGLPAAMPNPSVGAVLVFNNTIIGEGFTSAYGGKHAEVNAIESVKNKSLLSQATLYVSLEPCSHFGKTPPCADLIIVSKIKKVVVGAKDSNEKVAGKGIQKLLDAGIEVEVGILENECREVNKRFFIFHEKQRPFIILKWAQTLDGFIAPNPEARNSKNPVWITNEYSRQLVHQWRSEEQAILVGTTTVLSDNPNLNVRDFYGKNPIRLVLDKTGKINDSFHVKDNTIQTIVFTEEKNQVSKENLIYENCILDATVLNFICLKLFEQNIQSVIIEGGSTTLTSFIDAKLWDEARIFIGNTTFGNGIKAPKMPEGEMEKLVLKNDFLLKIKNHDNNHNF
jgi:diaminohydroxyphosphoribosylaminopyrimidine deaminase/5-amino-6-(5-phosphoribosylamino)uracil reductase